MKRLHFTDLSKGTSIRAIARIAERANGDTIMGGCSALMLAERAEKMKLPSSYEMVNAVSQTYAQSSGHTPDDCTVYECPECGQAHLGIENAQECCNWDAQDYDFDMGYED